MNSAEMNSPRPEELVRIDSETLPFATEFLQHAKEMAESMSSACRQGDLELVRGLAHKLKGSGRLFGLEPVSVLGRAIEAAADARDREPLEGLIGQLKAYLGRVQLAALEESRPRRVLIADDTDDIRDYLAHSLSKHGYETATAEDGTECLEKVPTFKPDLLVLDVMMPGIHGIEVLKKLKADPVASGIGVIVCSAKGYKSDIDQAMQSGAFAYLVKPFEKEDLLKTVAGFFSGEAKPASSIRQTGSPAKDQEPYRPSLDRSRPYLKLWGSRGSIPISGSRYVQHGGNTSCLEINDGESSIVIDAGSGIREAGIQLAARRQQQIHLFIGHTHWDHIQGFPFFPPAYIPGTSLTIYGASGFGRNLESVFSGQLAADYFPVQLDEMLGTKEFVELRENPVVVGKLRVYWEYVHHPGAAIGFKVECAGKSIVYLTDNEFLLGYLGPPHEIDPASELLRPYLGLIQFIQGVDLLIAEAQYPNEEYAKKIGWGHTGLSNGCLLAKLGQVKRWLVTHHDPAHDDVFLAEKLALTRQIMERIGYPIPVSHAHDGWMEFL